MDIKQAIKIKEFFIEMNKNSLNFKQDVKRVKKELKILKELKKAEQWTTKRKLLKDSFTVKN